MQNRKQRLCASYFGIGRAWGRFVNLEIWKLEDDLQ